MVVVKAYSNTNKQLMPHQQDAVHWFFSTKRTAKYLAADAGLGKTIVAASISNKCSSDVFYICPPFLVENTKYEFSIWCHHNNLHVTADTLVHKESVIKAIKQKLSLLTPKQAGQALLIVDEAHRFKNAKSRRTKNLLKTIVPLFKNSRILFMSGTPLPNSRPIEIWPVLEALAPDVFNMKLFQYAHRYCGAYQDRFGWHFDGCTNKREFKVKLLEDFMLRQRKEIIKLPPKIEGLLTVGDDIPPLISKMEKSILRHFSPEDLMQEKIAKANNKEHLHLGTYLRLLGDYKVKYVLPYIQSVLDETKENIIIFAVHKTVIEKLQKGLSKYNPIIINGDVLLRDRQSLVKEYQTDKARRVLIGNILACGVGFTLTKATRVIFAEYSWTDGDNSQASDRAHRIGQTNSVQVQYVVLKNSIDRVRIETLLNKRGNAI